MFLDSRWWSCSREDSARLSPGWGENKTDGILSLRPNRYLWTIFFVYLRVKIEKRPGFIVTMIALIYSWCFKSSCWVKFLEGLSLD